MYVNICSDSQCYTSGITDINEPMQFLLEHKNSSGGYVTVYNWTDGSPYSTGIANCYNNQTGGFYSNSVNYIISYGVLPSIPNGDKFRISARTKANVFSVIFTEFDPNNVCNPSLTSSTTVVTTTSSGTTSAGQTTLQQNTYTNICSDANGYYTGITNYNQPAEFQLRKKSSSGQVSYDVLVEDWTAGTNNTGQINCYSGGQFYPAIATQTRGYGVLPNGLYYIQARLVQNANVFTSWQFTVDNSTNTTSPTNTTAAPTTTQAGTTSSGTTTTVAPAFTATFQSENGTGPGSTYPNGGSNGSTIKEGAVTYAITGIPTAGSYRVTLYYQSGSTPPVADVVLNGGSTQVVQLINTDGVGASISFIVNSFTVGNNTMTITPDGYFAQDRIVISSLSQDTTTQSSGGTTFAPTTVSSNTPCNCNGTNTFNIVRNSLGQTVTMIGTTGRFTYNSCGVNTITYTIQLQGTTVKTGTFSNVNTNTYDIDLTGFQDGNYNFILTSNVVSGQGCNAIDSGTFIIGNTQTTLSQTTLSQTTNASTACKCNSVNTFSIIRNSAGYTVSLENGQYVVRYNSCGVTLLQYQVTSNGSIVKQGALTPTSNQFFIDLSGLGAGSYNFQLNSARDGNGGGCTATDSGTFIITGSTTAGTTVANTTAATTVGSNPVAVTQNDIITGGQIGIAQTVNAGANDTPCTQGAATLYVIETASNCTAVLIDANAGTVQVIPTGTTWFFNYSIYCNGIKRSNTATVAGSTGATTSIGATTTVTGGGSNTTSAGAGAVSNLGVVGNINYACNNSYMTAIATFKNNGTTPIVAGTVISVGFNGYPLGTYSCDSGTIANGFLTINRAILPGAYFQLSTGFVYNCSTSLVNGSICVQA